MTSEKHRPREAVSEPARIGKRTVGAAVPPAPRGQEEGAFASCVLPTGRGSDGSIGNPWQLSPSQGCGTSLGSKSTCSPLPESCQPALPSQPWGTSTSFWQVSAPVPPQQHRNGSGSPACIVRLPSTVSTREVMTWEMMNCKYPANSSLQPGPGPSKPTGNVSTGLGDAGPGPAGRSSALLPGEAVQDQLPPAPHPFTLGEMCFGWSPATSPTAEVAEKGDGKGQQTGKKPQEDFCRDSGTSQPDRLVCQGLVVSKMVLVDIFMASPSSFLLASCKEILNNFLGTKVILRSYICMK